MKKIQDQKSPHNFATTKSLRTDKIQNKIKAAISPMALVRLKKIVLNTGVGKIKEEKDREFIINHLKLIAGQKPIARRLKKSLSGFKARQGTIVGYKVTLRGKKMKDFLEKLIKITLARMRDFQGINLNSIDQSGGLTIPIPEHIVFPEISDEETRIIFGLETTLVPTKKNREEAIEFYKTLGVPFKK